MKCFITFLLLSILTALSLSAQKGPLKNRFSAGIVVGANTSQINGDNLSGYNQFGFFAGVRGITKLNRKAELVIEMQYNKKGSKDPDRFVPGKKKHRFIALNYIEIPILFHQKVESKMGVISLEGGIAYARLFGFKINEIANTVNHSTFSAIQDKFNKNELALIMGGGIFINEHIRVMMRFSYSLTLMYENENPMMDIPGEEPNINELRNLQLAFGVNYIL